MPSSHVTHASGAKLTATAVNLKLARSFCDSEFSVVTQPASASIAPSATMRASPGNSLKETPVPKFVQPAGRNRRS